MYTAMKNFQNVLVYLNQPKLPVTCDEGVYRIAREIQLIRPREFNNIMLCLDSFQMAKVALDCIGKYIKGSGAENILIESGVFDLHVVESVLGGKKLCEISERITTIERGLVKTRVGSFFH